MGWSALPTSDSALFQLKVLGANGLGPFGVLPMQSLLTDC
jgi:hypothetical protein